VRKDLNGGPSTEYFYFNGQIMAELNPATSAFTNYVYFDGDRVARRDGTTGPVSYYFSDHLKTATVITDSAGNITAESDYYPWGGELQFVNNDSNHYKFTGKERDPESGLDYFGARYYSNGLGRFITRDWAAKAVDVPYAEFSDPQSLNLYSYVRNLPTTKIDSDGHDAMWIVDKKTGQTTLVIPVHYTGSSATKENVSAIVTRDNTLNTGGSPVKIQVISTDKPINGVLNTLDLSPGKDTKNFGSIGEGVNKLGGNNGHIDMSNALSNEAAAHDTLHFAGIRDQYKEGPRDAQGNRTSTPTPGYDNSNIMTSRSGTKLKPQQIQEADKNKTTKHCTSNQGKTKCH
jgi:RHS repeat-associated protein